MPRQPTRCALCRPRIRSSKTRAARATERTPRRTAIVRSVSCDDAPSPQMRKKKRMDASFFVLLGLTLALVLYALSRDPRLVVQAASATGRLLRSVWMELLLGFALAGLVDVLVPTEVRVKWLGAERAGRGILVGWAAGLAIPGGP